TPTAVSATHVAYGTYRMEPVRMHFGMAAGVAAYLCLRYHITPSEVPAREVQYELMKRRAGTPDRPAMDGIGAPGPSSVPTYLYSIPDVTAETRKYAAIHWLAARGFWPAPAPNPRNARTVLNAPPYNPDGTLMVEEA